MVPDYVTIRIGEAGLRELEYFQPDKNGTAKVTDFWVNGAGFMFLELQGVFNHKPFTVTAKLDGDYVVEFKDTDGNISVMDGHAWYCRPATNGCEEFELMLKRFLERASRGDFDYPLRGDFIS